MPPIESAARPEVRVSAAARRPFSPRRDGDFDELLAVLDLAAYDCQPAAAVAGVGITRVVFERLPVRVTTL
ncbi:hypothetical protein [Nocardia xishanensis]|uniref:Uncharacterized protein n=1 Tax=Nocardia xishanensis TaxID=238964 RepID=A0ABW7XB20_9NOCA